MSLDLYLVYRSRLDDSEPVCSHCGMARVRHEAYWCNITHNLNSMACAVSDDFYRALWRPEELTEKYLWKVAKDFIPVLESGLEELKANPDKYKPYNAPNGWGAYEDLVRFVSDYLAACHRHPYAIPEAY